MYQHREGTGGDIRKCVDATFVVAYCNHSLKAGANHPLAVGNMCPKAEVMGGMANLGLLGYAHYHPVSTPNSSSRDFE